MKKILLTGSSGLIGQEVVDNLLKNNFDVYAISRRTFPSSKNLHYIKLDLFDTEGTNNLVFKLKPEYLLHLAWLSTGLFNDNIHFNFLASSINLVNQFILSGGKRLVIAGTYAEYGNNNSLLTEKTETDPQNVYAMCKDFLNKIVSYQCKKNNISYSWGRVFSAFGLESDNRRLTGDILHKLKDNKEVVIKNGNLIRDYIYNKDVAAAFVSILNSEIEGNINICSGKGTSIKDFAILIAKELGKEHLIKIENQLTQQPSKIIGNPSRLIEEVGYKFNFDLNSAIKDLCKNA